MRRLLSAAVLILAVTAGVAGVEFHQVDLLAGIPAAEAQTISSSTGVVGDVSCAGSAGTPTQIAPRRPRRVGLILKNKDTVAVRIGYDTGTTPLTTANSTELAASETISNGLERLVHELRCQSSDATARTVNVTETLQ